jgi:hypothetical protein
MERFGRMAEQYAEQSMSEDPVVVAEVGESIAQVDIPVEFNPQFSADMKIPFTNKPFIKFAMYSSEDDNGLLVLGESQIPNLDAKQLGDELEKSLRKKTGRETDLVVSETTTEEFTIRGKPASFTFVKGRSEDSETEKWHVVGSFQGESGPAMLIMMVDAERYDLNRLRAIVRSIK